VFIEKLPTWANLGFKCIIANPNDLPCVFYLSDLKYCKYMCFIFIFHVFFDYVKWVGSTLSLLVNWLNQIKE
jgi:hypothetical protein